MADLLDWHEKVAEAAVAWNRVRVFCERLREARSVYICERAKEGHASIQFDADWNETTDYRALPDAPCWKNWHENHYGDDLELDHGTMWCHSCRTRTLIHQAYLAAVRKRGARMRLIERYALLASKAVS